MEVGENVFESRASALEAEAKDAATVLARTRSGNPAVRAGSIEPSASGMENASKPGSRAGNLLDEAEGLSRWSKVLKGGGPIVAMGMGAFQISQGESPSRVGLEIAGGVVGGLAAGAAASALVAAGVIAAPAIVVAVGVALVGAAVAWGVGKAYESWVPQDVREKIDEGIKDTWHTVADPVGDAVSGAWHSVFG